MSDLEERELERKAAEGDAEAGKLLKKARERAPRPTAAPFGDEPGLRYVTNDREANEAFDEGHKVTMNLVKGDVVRVVTRNRGATEGWIGLYTEQKWHAPIGDNARFAWVIDALDAGVVAPNDGEIPIHRDARIYVLRRRGRRLA